MAAIGQAKSMGAIVRAFDTRSAVKEQVESLGGEFLTINIEVISQLRIMAFLWSLNKKVFIKNNFTKKLLFQSSS